MALMDIKQISPWLSIKHQRTQQRRDILGDKINVYKFKRIKITSFIILTDHNAIKLKIDASLTQIPKLGKDTTTTMKTLVQYSDKQKLKNAQYNSCKRNTEYTKQITNHDDQLAVEEVHRMGRKLCQLYIWQSINIQNIQTTKKNKTDNPLEKWTWNLIECFQRKKKMVKKYLKIKSSLSLTMIVSMDTEKAFNKIQYALMINSQRMYG